MSERDRGMAIAMLAEAFSVKADNLTPARIRIYDKALEKVPVPCLPPMVERVVATRKPRWGDLPAVSELLEDAEAVRLELRAALAYDGCIYCEGHKGFMAVPDRPRDVERCPCFARHQAKVAALGVGSEPLALPAADRDWTEVA